MEDPQNLSSSSNSSKNIRPFKHHVTLLFSHSTIIHFLCVCLLVFWGQILCLLCFILFLDELFNNIFKLHSFEILNSLTRLNLNLYCTVILQNVWCRWPPPHLLISIPFQNLTLIEVKCNFSEQSKREKSCELLGSTERERATDTDLFLIPFLEIKLKMFYSHYGRYEIHFWLFFLKISKINAKLDSSLVCFSFKKKGCVFLCRCSFDFEMCATCSPTYSYQNITASHLEHIPWLTFPKHILHSFHLFGI